MIHKVLLWGFLFFLPLGMAAQEKESRKVSYKNWVREERQFTDSFLVTDEAARIAENVMLYQQCTGGWPKNIYFPQQMSEADRQAAVRQKVEVNESTIDNNATTVEIHFLARMYLATGRPMYRAAVLDGIRYLLKAQYDNGGWPQFYPRPKGYYVQITYNDNAMVNVMNQLRDIRDGKKTFSFIPEETRKTAGAAFEKGVECILNTQVKQNGKLTVWCAQHDRETLQPCKARAYELPSLSGQESDNIVLLLMSLPDPSERVCAAIEGAVQWFRDSKIMGLRRENYVNAAGQQDFRMVEDPAAGPLWARFYTLDDNRPFFCDRDGVKRFDLSEIGHERRNGYGWYNDDGLKVEKKYRAWQKKWRKE